MTAFLQPSVPGYSPWPQARQEPNALRTPGVQGLQEGEAAGQGFAFSPTAEFFSGGTEGTAPPSSIPPNPNMWKVFGGAGGAPSSFASQGGDVLAPGNAQALIAALMGKQS
jgi:hypothetical protein